ncbi:Alpha/beta hydrolase family-domain-containing protein [Truncatella angustata]|uniref:Alpha/beta hydrolase family-domain-containing protein n=1 Tax=Truncatella angustata TaxID=152316 RepID=A0A9P8RKL5_9PEZI|nr:Alpha/beta hydrolase family-domain-containing protein [Truncatella angustata]KAH6647609.1 Alpha/beta hydrolase family-domain-containing protein [Truncatella angustata]
MEFPFHIKDHLIPTQHVREYARATANSQEDTLYLAVKQYIPKDNPSPQPGDVTIIGAHANGFPKELYEPLWTELHVAARSHGFRIRGIWIADVANQGYSGEANELTLGNDPSWSDHGRDLLHMTNVFRKEMPQPLVGVGHSFGANCLTHLSLLHPRLFTTLVLYDATITKFGFKSVGPGISPAKGSAYRRDTWSTAEEAAEGFRRSPFYKSWDPRVLEAWIAHGIRPAPTALFPDAAPGTVTLRTTKHQELFTFFRPLYHYTNEDGTLDLSRVRDFDPAAHEDFNGRAAFPFYRSEGPGILAKLPEVRPSVLFVAGETSDLSTPEKRKIRLETTGTGAGGSGGAKAGRVAEVLMKNRGHLFPMEVPGECAEHAAAWIGKEMGRYRQEQIRYEEWVRSKGLLEKSTMDEEWLAKIGPPPQRQPKGKGRDAKL